MITKLFQLDQPSTPDRVQPYCTTIKNENHYHSEITRSIATFLWRLIEYDGSPGTIDRILAIGYLCGFENDCQAWAGYLREVKA